MGMDDQRIVSEVTGNDLTVHKLWYSLKYDRQMVMAVEGDADVRMFLKGNDEHRYFYVGESDGPKRRAEKVGVSREGRTRSVCFKIEENLAPISSKKLGCGSRSGVIGKVVDQYSGTVAGVVTSGTNGRRWCCCGRQWWRERGSCLCVTGQLEYGGDGKVIYTGGSRKCTVLK
ncbi:hypothetical protein Cgig2_024084 [Carnegiea gigantea]|uniref:Uncharacterized protein n=1 Tax=Carnegiea gigantea TaxID=171969 RepID=A0A9Q1K6J7_9CARY|nr:hypothetical protein Cgig2_024084 [Carnegiea gigantea]